MYSILIYKMETMETSIQTDHIALKLGRPRKHRDPAESVEANRLSNYNNYHKNRERILARKKELRDLKKKSQLSS